MSQPLEFQTNGKSIKAEPNCQANRYIETEIKMMLGKNVYLSTVKLQIIAAGRLLLILNGFRGHFYLVNLKRLLKVRLLIERGYYLRVHCVLST